MRYFADKLPSGVLFDFDGVVLDTLPLHWQAWRLAITDLLGEQVPIDTSALAGAATSAIALNLSSAYDLDKKELINRKQEKLHWLSERVAAGDRASELGVPPSVMPQKIAGIVDFLRFLKKMGIAHGIASNAPREYVCRLLASVPDLCFSEVIGMEEGRQKPQPDKYLLLAKRLRLGVAIHSSIVVFEDTPHGILAARRAGMRAFGLSSQLSGEQLVAAGAEKTISDYRQLGV